MKGQELHLPPDRMQLGFKANRRTHHTQYLPVFPLFGFVLFLLLNLFSHNFEPWAFGVCQLMYALRVTFNATKYIVPEIQNHFSKSRRFGIKIQDLPILCLQGHGQQGDKISIHRKCLKFNPCLSSCVGRVHRQQWNTGKKAYFRQNCWKILRIQVLPVFC